MHKRLPTPRFVFAVILISLGFYAFISGFSFLNEGYRILFIGFILDGFINVTTTILVLMNHRSAIHFARACAVLFTLSTLISGLRLLDLMEAVALWIIFVWYKSWRMSPEDAPLT